MMKTLCVAVVLLSLTSVCQPAPLVCEELLKPVVIAPNLTGTWYWIAMSTDHCVVTQLIKAVPLSIETDLTSTESPDYYHMYLKKKIYRFCKTEYSGFYYPNNSISALAYNNSPFLLLHSGCPDCIVVKGNRNYYNGTAILLSKRKNVTAAELREFERQTKCLGLSKPQLLHSDHDYDNCRSIENQADKSSVETLLVRRLKTSTPESIKCIAKYCDRNSRNTENHMLWVPIPLCLA